MTLIEEEEIAVMVKKTLADALPIGNTPGPVDVTGEEGFAALSLLYIDARGDLFIKEQQNQPLVWDGTDVTIGATNSEYVKISGTGLQFFCGSIERFRIDIPNNDLIFYGSAGEAFFSVQQADSGGGPFLHMDATALASDTDVGMSMSSSGNASFILSADEDNDNAGDPKIGWRINSIEKAGIFVDASDNDYFKIQSNDGEIIFLQNAAIKCASIANFEITDDTAAVFVADCSGSGDASLQLQISGSTKGQMYVDNDDNDIFRVESTLAEMHFSNTAKRIDIESTNLFAITNQNDKIIPGGGRSGLTTISGDLYAVNEGGTETQISAHDKEGNYIFKSRSVDGRELIIDMEKLLKFLNDHFELDFFHETST